MFLLKKSLYIICFILFKNVKSQNIELIEDEIYTLSASHSIHCIRSSYIPIHNEVYKLCYFNDKKKGGKHDILIQMKDGDQWKEHTQLLKDINIDINKFFSYSIDNKIIIISCRMETRHFSQFMAIVTIFTYDCYLSSFDGTKVNKHKIRIPSSTDLSTVSTYSTVPYTFEGKELLLLCAINKPSYFYQVPRHFITCVGSDDNGSNWKYNFHFYYSRTNHHNYDLKPKINKTEIGFQFTKRVNDNEVVSYINCTWNSKSYAGIHSYECKYVNLDKENTHLREVSKINNNYITGHTNDDNKAYYIYYQDGNSILINPKNHKYEKNSQCNPLCFIKLDSKLLVINSNGANSDSFYIYRYAKK